MEQKFGAFNKNSLFDSAKLLSVYFSFLPLLIVFLFAFNQAEAQSRNGNYRDFYPNGNLKTNKTYYFNPLSKSKNSKEIGWTSNYSEDGSPESKFYYDSIGGLLISRRYFGGKLKNLIIPLLQVDYSPFGEVASLNINSNWKVFGMYFFRNGNMRKLEFQNPENSNLSTCNFASDGSLMLISSDQYPNPDSLLPSTEIINQIISETGMHFIPNAFFTDSVLQGNYILKNATGSTLAQMSFENDLPNGNFVVYDPLNRDTLLYQHFQQGNQTGYYLEKHAGKIIKKRGVLPSVTSAGWSEIYNQQGLLKEKITFFSKDKIKTQAEYFEEGQIKSERNEELNTYRSFYLDGSLISSSEKTGNGSRTLSKTYYKGTNQVKTIVFYLNGKIDSLSEQYYANGILQNKSTYSAGKRQGISISLDSTGRVKNKGQYSDDKQDGLWISFKSDKNDSIWYNDGKLNVNPLKRVCGCQDTTHSYSKLGFAPQLNFLLSYEELKRYIPPFIKKFDSLQYKSLFYRSYDPLNNREYNDGSMQLELFDNFSFSYPADEQLQISLNPCLTEGYATLMNIYYSSEKYIGNKPSLIIEPNRISISFLKGPLKSANTDYRNFTAFLGVEKMFISEKEGISMSMETYSCFTPAIAGDFLKLSVQKAIPYINIARDAIRVDDYQIPDGLFSSDELKEFFGLIIKEASLKFNYPTINGRSVRAQAVDLYAGGNFFAGTIRISCKNPEKGIYTVKNEDQDITMTEDKLKTAWTRHGFSRLKFNYISSKEELHIQFFIR